MNGLYKSQTRPTKTKSIPHRISKIPHITFSSSYNPDHPWHPMDRFNAFSLPSHFRYRSPRDPPPSPFFRLDDELPVQTVDTTPPKTRLEVLKGWEVSFTVLCLYTASFLAFLYLVLKLRYSQLYWENHHQIPDRFQLETLLDALLQGASFVLPLFFGLSLLLALSVTDEQLWTLILLIVGLCATNPLTKTDANSSQAHLIINDAVYTAAIYLYLLLAAHSYRVFDIHAIHTVAFYLPKLAAATLYLIVKLVAGFKFGVCLGLIPYSRILTWLLLQRAGRSSLRVTVPVLLTTLLDTAVGCWLVHEVASTSEFLATVPYVENRSKQLGFRCFVYQTLAFCFNMIGLSLLITYMLPRTYLYSAFDNPPGNLLQLEPPIGRLGLALVYVTWTVVIAYVNLPPTPILPIVQHLVSQLRFLVRNNRVAGWMGLADIVDTEDAEDSDDGTEMMPLAQDISPTPATIPLRYRHREAFDEVGASPHQVRPVSPLVLSARWASPAHRSSQYPDVFNELPIDRFLDHRQEIEAPPQSSSTPGSVGSQPIEIAGGGHSQDSMGRDRHLPYSFLSPESSGAIEGLKRLRLRKNLFVMETAVMMANAAYLSYIPGNPKEERKQPDAKNKTPLLHTGSLSTDLDDLARQIEEENEMIASPFGRRASVEPEQPDHDDGTMFRVNPEKIAEWNGYRLYKHVHDEMLNTHAIVLVNSSRVIVAFSGTRDVTNWGVNANFKRTVLDEKLSRFEYEFCDDNEEAQEGKEIESVNDAAELSLETFDFIKLAGNAGRNFGKTDGTSSVRRSRSEARLLEEMENGQLRRAATSAYPSGHQTRYGTLDVGARRGSPVYNSREEHGISRTGHGVTMVATAIAKELLTFGQPKVHEGFIEAYMSLRKRIMGTLIELYRGRDGHGEKLGASSGTGNSLPLFFCGHSLGGALATFASYEAARYYKRIGIARRQDITCTTFGCPRIGNDAFKARYERLVETHWRFELAADPIPRMPTLFLNYVPVGVQVLIDQSGMLLIDPSFIEVQWWGQLSNLYLGYRLHIRASYCMALRTYCKLYKNGTDALADKFWPFPIRVQTKGLFRHAQD